MNKSSVLTQTNLDDLLHWLDRDRELAGRKYEQIRRTLIKIFAARGCHCAEELADETLTRVAHKAAALATTYQGDPSLFFYGVAKNVYREYLKDLWRDGIGDVSRILQVSRHAVEPTVGEGLESRDEARLQCLTKCLLAMPFEQRELVTKYYEEEKGAKIESRKSLAEQYRLSINALRLKAHRLRESLRRCVLRCLEGGH
jgi:DNA-directed RNA polymerase specialized sigma24 family protein